ncbi:MAG: hypothetical protein SGARI_006342 [Bacillariaceae sp.]
MAQKKVPSLTTTGNPHPPPPNDNHQHCPVVETSCPHGNRKAPPGAAQENLRVLPGAGQVNFKALSIPQDPSSLPAGMCVSQILGLKQRRVVNETSMLE